MSGDLALLSILGASRLLRARALSPVDIVRSCLARIAAHDGQLHSVLHLDEAEALVAAQQAEAEIMRGLDRGPLHGLPIGIKDLFDVTGMPTRWNSRLPHEGHVVRDADVVARLRAGGAIILGKLAAWECGVGTTSFDLPWPPPRNPWAIDRDPGGSSSGSAVAVAAGFCFGAVGSDTGGSIREPASWCGIAGLKPTYGRVPGRGGMAASFSLDHVGPMGRTSADCAAMLDAMVPDAAASRDIAEGVAGLRIGLVELEKDEHLALAPEVAAVLASTSSGLEKMGARVSSVRLPPLDLFGAVVTIIAAAEGYALHRARLEAHAHLYDPPTRQRLMVGARVAASDYIDALCVRRRLIDDVSALFAHNDLLLMPATRSEAPVLGGFDSHGGHPSLCRPWNVTGFPALSVCTGLSGSGLPLSVQIIGRPFEDGLVLRAGHAVDGLPDSRPRAPLAPGAAVLGPAPAAVSETAALDALAHITERAAARVRGAATTGLPASGFAPARLPR